MKLTKLPKAPLATAARQTGEQSITKAPLDRAKELVTSMPAIVSLARYARRFSEAVFRRRMQHGYDDPTINGEDWLVRLAGRDVRRFIDVGGNRGHFAAAMLAQSPAAAGLVFDPAGTAIDSMRSRFAANRNIEMIRAAVSDRLCTAEFFEEPDAGLGSSLLKSCAAGNAKRTEVAVTTLDHETELRGWHTVDFLKIDAEGHDLAALRGASRLLSRNAILLLQFEYHHTWRYAGATLRAALDLLGSHGYKTMLLKGECLYEIEYDAYGEYFGYSNYVATPCNALGRIGMTVRGAL
jgi:FkbM family methyltransferase